MWERFLDLLSWGRCSWNALCNHAQLTRFLTFRSGRYFDSTLSHLAWSFSLQSIIKHLLTEGDKIVLVGSSTAEDMGVYAYVSNYGNSFAYQIKLQFLLTPLPKSHELQVLWLLVLCFNPLKKLCVLTFQKS